MKAITTKFQVTAAAAAIAAGAAFAPAAANAAPAAPVPAAPVQQMVGGVSEAPGDLLYYSQVISLQVVAANIRFRSFVLDSRAQRLAAYAERYPETAFGRWAAAASERLQERRAKYGDITFTACRGNSGLSVGPYGTITTGRCSGAIG